jgi:hypothetical protein
VQLQDDWIQQHHQRDIRSLVRILHPLADDQRPPPRPPLLRPPHARRRDRAGVGLHHDWRDQGQRERICHRGKGCQRCGRAPDGRRPIPAAAQRLRQARHEHLPSRDCERSAARQLLGLGVSLREVHGALW